MYEGKLIIYCANYQKSTKPHHTCWTAVIRARSSCAFHLPRSLLDVDVDDCKQNYDWIL